jgi:hypothetical protein
VPNFLCHIVGWPFRVILCLVLLAYNTRFGVLDREKLASFVDSRLHISKSCYDIHQAYDSTIFELQTLPSVLRHDARGLLVETLESPPKHFQWWPAEMIGKWKKALSMMVLPSKSAHLKVSPEHLTTGMLRLTKSQDSAYLLSKMVPLREVDAATSDRNCAMLRN